MTDAPAELYTTTIPAEWIDYNGHMSEGFYSVAFAYTTDAWMDYIGLDAGYRARTRGTIYTVEVHINFLRDLRLGDELRHTTQLLGYDTRRMHVFHAMYHVGQGYLAATCEAMLLHVDQNIERVAPMSEDILAFLEEIQPAHAALPRPSQAGRSISL